MTLTVITPEPANDSVVTLLRNMLARAEAGELSSLAIAAVHRDGCSDAQWSDVPSMPALIGAVARLEHRLHLEADT